jgi:selenophosphate synthetase-related protein
MEQIVLMLMYEPPIGKVVDFTLVKNGWCSVVVFTTSDVVVGSSVVCTLQTLLAPGNLQFRVRFPFDNAIKYQMYI